MSEPIEQDRSIEPNDYRLALGLLGLVVGLAVGLLTVAVALDVSVMQVSWSELWAAIRSDGLSNSMGSLAEVLAAILGLSLTVVAIVVQLASARYPAKIVDLFMFDRVNILVFGFMAASCIYVVLVPLLAVEEPPPIATTIGLILAVGNFGLLLPYFGHVFAFLEPTNLITKIEVRAAKAIDRASTASAGSTALRTSQWQAATSIERIADNCMAAVSQSDRNLALHSVRTLEQVVVNYFDAKQRLPDAWDEIDHDYFGTLAVEFVQEIVENGTWFEAKALMEYERIIRRSLHEMSEVVSQLALSTRVIGDAAVRRGDADAVDLVIRFFNTYIRHGLNARNVRAVYNILYEYRTFAREVFAWDAAMGQRIVEHLVYYGRTSNDLGMPFVTVTCAHDVRAICEHVYGYEGVQFEKLLALFLTLDQPSERKSEEVALIGVRKAQSILGAFFLMEGRADYADMIRHDMRHENSRRLAAIRDEVLDIKERKFWEITDRGHNFDYVAPEMRPHFTAFFEPMLS